MLSPNKINIKIRWDLKSRLLAYVLYERLPEDGRRSLYTLIEPDRVMEKIGKG